MTMGDSQLSERDQFEEIAESFLTACRNGEQPSITDYVQKFPEYAEQLRELLPTLLLLEDFAPNHEEVEPQSTLGDFRIVREVARGGMGVVYEADQLSLNRRVALKVLPFAAMLDNRQRKRFVIEAQAAATLNHPNIVPVYGTGCERGVHYFAMQFIDGDSVSNVVTSLREAESSAPRTSTINRLGDETEFDSVDGLVSKRIHNGHHYTRSIAKLGLQVALALEHAHQDGIIHRDVKPSNLILDRDGKVWLSDFGLARIQQTPTLTVTGDVIGTLRYMSPEQALAKSGVADHRCDIYSLGATLYELLTLCPLREDADREQMLRRIADDEPMRPRRINQNIPVDLETIVLKAIEREPDDRYQSASELATDLRAFLDERPIRAQRPTALDRLYKWSRRHKRIAAAVVALLLFLTILTTAFAAVLSRQQKELLRQRKSAMESRARAIVHRSQGLAVFNDLKSLYEDAAPSNKRWIQIELQFLRRERDFYRVVSGSAGYLSREIVHTMAKVQSRIAELQHWSGSPQQALVTSTDALKLLQRLANAEGTRQIQQELSQQHCCHGDILVTLRRSPEAARHFAQAINLLDRKQPLKLAKLKARELSARRNRHRLAIVSVKPFTKPNPELVRLPTFLTFGPDANQDGHQEIYVTTLDQHSVVRFDGKTGRLMDQFIPPRHGGLNRPTGLVFGPDANNDGIPELFVACWSANCIMRYDGATGKPLSGKNQAGAMFIQDGHGGLKLPESLLLDHDGHLVVALGRGGRLARFHSLTGQFLGNCLDTSEQVRDVMSFCFATQNNRIVDVFVSNVERDEVLRYDYSRGQFTGAFISPRQAGLDFPRGVIIGPDGHLYVASRDTREILRFDGTTGAFLDIVAQEIPQPFEIAADQEGDLYVTGYASNGGVIMKITLAKSPAGSAVKQRK